MSTQIRLFCDDTIGLDIESIANNLNKICQNIEFVPSQSECVLPDDVIQHPATYEKLSQDIKEEVSGDFLAVLITKKKYDNNYFFNTYDNQMILSLFGWEYLTTLPFNNGLVFFIANILALKVDNTYRHGKDNPKPECIYDFGWDKRGIDISMRSALICPGCIERISRMELSTFLAGIFADLKVILNDLGAASKWEEDIVRYWEERSVVPTNSEGDIRDQVFISYSHKDADWLMMLRAYLKPFQIDAKINVFEDTIIKTGEKWKEKIESALKRTKVAVLLLSEHFLGSEFIRKNELPPLLAAAKSEGTEIFPVFLRPCNEDKFPDICQFQAVNPPSNTLLEMSEGERARTIVKLVDDILRALGIE
jgi:hypothetical protein